MSRGRYLLFPEKITNGPYRARAHGSHEDEHEGRRCRRMGSRVDELCQVYVFHVTGGSYMKFHISQKHKTPKSSFFAFACMQKKEIHARSLCLIRNPLRKNRNRSSRFGIGYRSFVPSRGVAALNVMHSTPTRVELRCSKIVLRPGKRSTSVIAFVLP